MIRLWFVHWLTAALLAFLLVTSLPFVALEWFRPSPRSWLAVHLTAGWIAIVITAYRLGSGTYIGQIIGGVRSRHISGRSLVKMVLLLLIIAVLVTGLVIYRPSPLLKPVRLFGLFTAAPIVELPHSADLQAISAHRIGVYLVAALLVVHVLQAFSPVGRAGKLPIASLWEVRPRRQSDSRIAD